MKTQKNLIIKNCDWCGVEELEHKEYFKFWCCDYSGVYLCPDCIDFCEECNSEKCKVKENIKTNAGKPLIAGTTRRRL